MAKEYDTLELIRKRIELLVGARLKPQDSIKTASQKIDKLREKYGDVEDGYNSVKIIRKWRDRH
jgi:protoheme ferro-lyase